MINFIALFLNPGMTTTLFFFLRFLTDILTTFPGSIQGRISQFLSPDNLKPALS
jgi:hypothetical protein